MFDYNNFEEINYLNFAPKFKIELDYNMKLILGANGTVRLRYTRIFKKIIQNIII